VKSDWQELLSGSIVDADALCRILPAEAAAIRTVGRRYPMRINRYYLSLIREKNDPIWRQAVPDMRELAAGPEASDPLSEEDQSPVPHLTHRYPDRVLLLVSSRCAVYCRFCMRKRKVGTGPGVSPESVREGIAYIQSRKSIREVVLSGGDPFLLDDAEIEAILRRLRSIRHVEILRIHTRVPCTLPQRITPRLAGRLRRFHPLFIHTHFNHPDEITPQAAAACDLLSDAGIPLGCQTVLLRNVNDDPSVLSLLMRKLLSIRVNPYYLHHPDPVRGTAHFRLPVAKGVRLLERLREDVPLFGVPKHMIDLPGGGGKVELAGKKEMFSRGRSPGHPGSRLPGGESL
jgi:lysine 2,3-aminomutase